MAHFKSLFTGSSSGSSKVDHALPPPPTTREMLDDIERCDDNDPVMIFAKQLKKEVRRNSRSQPQSPGGHGYGHGQGQTADQFSSSSSASDEDDDEEDEDEFTDAQEEEKQTPNKKKDARINFPAMPQFVAALNQISAHPKTVSQEQILHANVTYNRLRTLSNLLESSENMIDEIEPKFKKLNAEAKEFLDFCRKANAKQPREGDSIKMEDDDEDDHDESLL